MEDKYLGPKSAVSTACIVASIAGGGSGSERSCGEYLTNASIELRESSDRNFPNINILFCLIKIKSKI
jgi:hypothetical protein